MEYQARYCTSADGTRIAYCVYGEGPPLVRCPRGWESFNNELDESRVYDLLEEGRTVVRYDPRGVGLSQRGVSSFKLDELVADLEAVVAAVGLTRFAMWGGAFSSAAAMAYAARHPECVQRLLVEYVMARGSDVMPRANFDALIGMVRTNWEMGSQVLADLTSRTSHPTWGISVAERLRQNMEQDDLIAMLTDLYDMAVLDQLPRIQCPTLILHRKENAIPPFASAQEVASVVPEARLLALPGSGQASVGEDAEANLRAEAAFLDEDSETRSLSAAPPTLPASDSAFRTVLFTDIVGHTDMMSRLGDEKGRDVLREHERITREVLAANGGTEVKTMGDGFMASFGSVTKAVECAIALQRAFAERECEPLSVRVGLNAGEPIEEDGDLFGATVILASRISAKAEGGEILVADTVRGLCSGKGFLFADRGEFVAKGFEEPVRVYEVRWRD